MSTRTWTGAVGDWNTDADWLPATTGSDTPLPADSVIIAGGTVILTTNLAAADGLFENNVLTLGGSASPTLLLRDASPIGRYFAMTIAGSATIEADGIRGIAASVNANPNDGSTITFKADLGGELVFLNGGTFNVSDRTVDFEGDVTLERNAMISADFVNNGVLSILSGKTVIASNSLTGTGTIAIGANGELSATPSFGSSGANQTITFSGLGGKLDLAYNTPTNFAGKITNFAPGDFIGFTGNGPIASASVDVVAHTLSITDSSSTYVIQNFYGQAGALTSATDPNGFSVIGYADPTSGKEVPRLDYQIDAGARAMHADVVHQMTAPGTTTPINGAGVKIGIISDSFNIKGGYATDIAGGYLPTGVTILREGSTGDIDEGRAMAELIYQTAPGASLYFASAGSGDTDFAASVQALQTAGCTVIVDDIGFGDEPYFQLGGPAENAIEDAIGDGVAFVSSAGNRGDSYYQHAFTTSTQTLYDGSTVQAMTFSNGTPYQNITANGGLFDSIVPQWDASFYGAGGVAADQPCAVTIKAFDPSTNALLATSAQVSVNGHLVAETILDLPPSNSTKTYNIAICRNDGAPDVNEIKYIIAGVSPTGGAGVGGRVNDPDAGYGDGAIAGHALIPGNITVGAVDVANTPATGEAPDFTEYFSSTGPGELLFDANGNRIAQPAAAGLPDVVGPDGIQTSVTGFTPFYGTSAAAPNVAAVAALVQQVRPDISPAALASILAQSATPLSGEPVSTAGAGLVQADRAILLAEAACYCAGTLILTSRGERPIEKLEIGDVVITASGGRRPVKWLGHRRIDVSKHRTPTQVWPVRIAKGAFAPGLPRRDLWVSPGHGIAWGGALVPAVALANGRSVVQVERASVEYWHVEFDAHDILLAEGLPAESYLDTGNRTAFANGGAFIEAHPDFLPRHWAETCLPLATEGPAAAGAKALLMARLAEQGCETTEDADAHICVDGLRVEPIRLGQNRLAFALPRNGSAIFLRSRTFVPVQIVPESADARSLGLSIRALQVDGSTVSLRCDEDCPSGWHRAEFEGERFSHRWTAGAARLPAGARIVIVDLAGDGRYWRDFDDNFVALSA